jgi:D-arabinose 1-dehydrogenase-like Zn-dependent alcohol dehydrogenase
LIFTQISIRGHAAGTACDIEETMQFAVQAGVRSRNEIVPLEEAPAALGKMLSGKARFRMVLTTGR